MSMAIDSGHANELSVVDEALDPQGGAVVALDLINQVLRQAFAPAVLGVGLVVAHLSRM